MALLHFDGFDTGNQAFRYTLSGTVGATTSTAFATGRALEGLGMVVTKAITASSEVFVGVRVNAATLDSTIRATIAVFGDTGATRHLTVGINSTGVEVRRGLVSGTLIASYALSSFTPNTWYYMEAYCKIADTGGRCTVKINGTTLVDFTGDTKNAGTATNIDAVQVAANGVIIRMDDLYVCDSTGSAPYNTFLGDVRVVTLVPTGAGATTGMTPSTGANYTCVDELPYSATDYVTGATGQKDTYALGDLPSGVASVLAVQTNLIAKKSDAGALSIKTITRSAGTDYAGSTASLGTADDTIMTTRTTDPATSAAWTTSGVNALEVGAEVV